MRSYYLDQRTGWFIHHSASVGCQSSTQEGGAEVDGDTGKPWIVEVVVITRAGVSGKSTYFE